MTKVNVCVVDGLITLPDGKEIDLLKIQAVLNYALHELNDDKFAQAIEDLKILTGHVQGPMGDFRPIEISEPA